MAKRFTDSEKYKKPFLRSLPGAYKLLWDYICNDCNHAGIWIVDEEIAQIYVGRDIQFDLKKAIELFNKDKQRVITFDNDSKWFITTFIEFQYGTLNPNNKAHNSVIHILKQFNLIDFKDNKIRGYQAPNIAPLLGANIGSMDKDMDKDIDIDRGGQGEEETNDVIIPVAEIEQVPPVKESKSIGQKMSKTKKFKKPTVAEIEAYCIERKNGINAQQFFDSNEAKGWVIGKNQTPMVDWQAAIRTWEKNRVGDVDAKHSTQFEKEIHTDPPKREVSVEEQMSIIANSINETYREFLENDEVINIVDLGGVKNKFLIEHGLKKPDESLLLFYKKMKQSNVVSIF